MEAGRIRTTPDADHSTIEIDCADFVPPTRSSSIQAALEDATLIHDQRHPGKRASAPARAQDIAVSEREDAAVVDGDAAGNRGASVAEVARYRSCGIACDARPRSDRAVIDHDITGQGVQTIKR